MARLFQEWVEKTYKKIELGKQQAYCRKCDMAVDMVNPTLHRTGDTDYLISKCPNCGRKLWMIKSGGDGGGTEKWKLLREYLRYREEIDQVSNRSLRNEDLVAAYSRVGG